MKPSPYALAPRVFILVIVLASASCAGSGYRVERLEGSKSTTVPLKFDSVSGERNGDVVRSEIRFADGADNIRIRLTLHLAPSAECTSAAYSAVIGGEREEGVVV